MIKAPKKRNNQYTFPRGDIMPPGKVHIGHTIRKERKNIKRIIESELLDVYDELPTNLEIK